MQTPVGIVQTSIHMLLWCHDASAPSFLRDCGVSVSFFVLRKNAGTPPVMKRPMIMKRNSEKRKEKRELDRIS